MRTSKARLTLKALGWLLTPILYWALVPVGGDYQLGVGIGLALGLLGGGSLLSGLGSLFQDSPDSGDIRIPFLNALRDPLSSSLGLEALFGLGGGFSQTISQQGSPLEAALAELDADPTLSIKQKRRAANGIRHFARTGQMHPDGKIQSAVRAASARTGLGGFGDLGSLRQAQTQFTQREAEFQERFGGLGEQIRGDRATALANLARLGAQAGGNIEELTQQFMPEIQRQFAQQREDVLAQAQARGFNPAGAIGQLAEAEATGGRRLAIDRALQALGGQIGLIGSSLQPGQQFGLGTQQGRISALSLLQGGGNLAAQQAFAAAQQRSQQGLPAALFNIGETLGAGGAGLLGAGRGGGLLDLLLNQQAQQRTARGGPGDVAAGIPAQIRRPPSLEPDLGIFGQGVGTGQFFQESPFRTRLG